jgi:hypothetical protein
VQVAAEIVVVVGAGVFMQEETADQIDEQAGNGNADSLRDAGCASSIRMAWLKKKLPTACYHTERTWTKNGQQSMDKHQ